MAGPIYTYVIVGGGIAAASAIRGIRELNEKESILVLSREKDLPYDRTALSKKIWFGKKKIEDLFIEDENDYRDLHVEFKRGVDVVTLEPSKKEIFDSEGNTYRYQKLLLATGGTPRVVNVPGAELTGLCYYRSLEDYRTIRAQVAPGKSAIIIGGGFIGSEMAAALSKNQVNVTMVFPEKYLVERVFPESLGRALQDQFRQRGVQVLSEDVPLAFERTKDKFFTRTRSGRLLESDFVIIGVGIYPSVALAQSAGLAVNNGIVVDEYLQTSQSDIYAAGDNANFPYLAFGKHQRIEHWDHALNQGKLAGRNMAGAHERYDYMPYFFSDLFEFGYEAVGQIDSKLETSLDWEKENHTGIIYYHQGTKLYGVMMCNVWDKVPWARDLIRQGEFKMFHELPKAA